MAVKDIKITGDKLIGIPIFSNLNNFEAETLLQITSVTVFKDKELIFREGTLGDSLYVILDGTVDIVKQVGNKEFKTLARLNKDTAFGEMTLIHDEVTPRSASAIARERTRLLIIHKDDFQKLLDFGSVIAYKVTLNICRLLSDRLAKVDREWEELMKHADENVRKGLQEFNQKKRAILTDSEDA
jgi:CRP-like cAMP-binding protein